MKIFKLMAIALVAMLGFTACEKDCDHDFIEVDYSNDIVGTWTCLEPDHSAAYIFNADGTLSTTGFDGDAHWEDEKGTYSVVNNKITMKFESGRIINGSFDIIPGKTSPSTNNIIAVIHFNEVVVAIVTASKATHCH